MVIMELIICGEVKTKTRRVEMDRGEGWRVGDVR